MGRKHFILSTRTLVSKRNVTQSFDSDNTVYVPLAVMEEIESKYYDRIDERGRIAREVLEYLGSFHIDDLRRGIKQENGSILKVVANYYRVEIPKKISCSELSKLDMRILQTCMGIKGEIPQDETVVLVSKKSTLRKKAELLGIKAQTFRDELLPEIAEQYTGRRTVHTTDEVIRQFREERKIPLESVFSLEELKNVFANMFIKLKSNNNWAYGRVFGDSIVSLQFENYNPYGVKPKNIGQKFMIEALMHDEKEAPLVIVKGPAGTAKTFLSLAVGLEFVEQKRFANNILISRSPTETGEKIGFLPGGELDKIGPYLRGIMDNLNNLHSKDNSAVDNEEEAYYRNGKGKKGNKVYEKPFEEDGTYFLESKHIKAEAVGYIRGRSICDTYIIIDEAQNLSPIEVKTIVTRIGTGSKLILIGDPGQIDRPELDERNNGLSYASERLKGEPTCWQITMTDEESVRSEVAKRASILL